MLKCRSERQRTLLCDPCDCSASLNGLTRTNICTTWHLNSSYRAVLNHVYGKLSEIYAADLHTVRPISGGNVSATSSSGSRARRLRPSDRPGTCVILQMPGCSRRLSGRWSFEATAGVALKHDSAVKLAPPTKRRSLKYNQLVAQDMDADHELKLRTAVPC